MENLLEKLIPNVMARLPDFFKAIGDTLVMVGWSGIIAFVFGLFFGIVVTVTRPGGILENKILYQILDKLINFFRAIPFIILLTWVSRWFWEPCPSSPDRWKAHWPRRIRV